VAKGDKGKKGASAAPDDHLPRLSAHPRARAHIGMAKAWAGLIGFVAVTLLSRGAEVPWFDSLLRGLVAGIIAYVVAWAAAVVVWRHIATAELEVLRRRTEERLRAEQEAADAARRAEDDETGAA
jgi:uncharacterized membrane protein YccC